MKGKIEEILKHTYFPHQEDRSIIATVQLEKLFDEEILLFLSFLRENYFLDEVYGEGKPLPSCRVQDVKTEEIFIVEEIYKQWKKD